VAHARALARVIDRATGGEIPPEVTNTLRESMRLYTPVWAFARINTEPCEIGEHVLPAGTHIFFVPHLTHRLDRFESPDSFRPERWDDERSLRDAYLPFGASVSACTSRCDSSACC
jgi:cytochrome P450